MLTLTEMVGGMQSRFGGCGKVKTLVWDILNLDSLLEIYVKLMREVWAGEIHLTCQLHLKLGVWAKGVIKDRKEVMDFLGHFRDETSG